MTGCMKTKVSLMTGRTGVGRNSSFKCPDSIRFRFRNVEVETRRCSMARSRTW